MSTILIVDDRRANRDYLETLLSYAGHRLLGAADGAEALASARAERPDLIIADILMPTMDGFELVRQLREDPAIAKTPVIFWTAHYHEREAQALAVTCGVVSVITKPSEPEVVLNAVQSALGFAAPASPAPVTGEFDREHLRLLTDKLSQNADALRSSNERLSALVELNLQLGSETDLRRLLQNFGRSARQIVGARYSITAILDESGKHFRHLFTSGMDAEAAAQLGSWDPGTGVLKNLLRDGRCIRLRNPGGDPEALGFPRSHPPVHSWLGAPIASPTRVYGYIGLTDRIGHHEFSCEDERLARILAAQTGRIYQNGSLYSEVLSHAADLEREIVSRSQTEKALAERERQGSLIGEIGVSLTRGDTLPTILQLCAEALVRCLDVALARIWTFNEDENVLELKASAGLYTNIDGRHSRVPLGQLKIGRIAKERKPHFTNDVLTDPRVSDKEWAKREGMIAFAGYPLVVDERLVGVVGMFARRPLSSSTVDSVGSVAHQVALGIERHRATEILREREEHIRLLLDSTAEAIYGIDRTGRCTFANSASARLLGYESPSHLLGCNMHDLVHHSCRDGTPYPADECKIFRAYRENQASHVDDEVLWRADGSSFPVEYWSHPICRDGQVVGSVVTFLDITERRKLEDQYRTAQQRLQEIVVSSPAVLFTLAMEPDGIRGMTWVSDNLRDVLGYSPDAAIGSEWWYVNVHPDDMEEVKLRTTSGLIERDRATQEWRFRHADGAYRWIRSDLRLLRDRAGRPVEAVGAWLDITEKRRAEEEQSRLREQLQQAQKLESVGRLAGGVAHDFNNLLTVINGYSDLLLRKLKPDDPMHESISEIRKAGQLAANLTRQLLLLSRKQVTQTSEVNLNDVIEEVEKMLTRVIGEDIRLEWAPDPHLGRVLADAGQLHQILMNLAINARDAMPGGGTLLIETKNVDLEDAYAEHHAGVQPGAYVRLNVSDTGIGMTKDVLAHLFEPFFTTKKPGEGTGLGLATVYGIVKQAGGSIWVYSEPGRGTKFTIYLPRIVSEVKPFQKTEAAPSSLRGNETILVVEDQELLRRMAASVLRSYGYRVLEAANPGEALLHSERYAGLIHLMLTDVVMPGITGPELAARIKPLRPAMAVAFMSGYSERVITERMQLEGTYLAKPFTPEALATKVREVLGNPRPAGAVLVLDKEPRIRKLVRDILAGVGYQVVEAENGSEAVRQIGAFPVNLAILDLTMPEREASETIKTLRGMQSQLRIVALFSQEAGIRPDAVKRLDLQASLVKPIHPDDLLDTVALVLIGRREAL